MFRLEGHAVKLKRGQAAWLAIGLALVVFALLFLFNARQAGNDDIASYASMIGSDRGYCLFQHPLLGRLIHGLQQAMPDAVNWFFAWQFMLLLFSAAAMFYCILRCVPIWELAVFSVTLTVMMFWCYVFRCFSFTRTSAFAGIAGAALMMTEMKKQQPGIGRWTGTALGALLWCGGAMTRFEMALVGLAFGMMAYCWCVFIPGGRLSDLKETLGDGKRWLRLTALILPVALAVGVVVSWHGMMNDEEQAYEAYNTLRSNIQDYSDKYPPYSEEVREATGMEEWEYLAVRCWRDTDAACATPEGLSRVCGLAKKTTFQDMKIGLVDIYESIVSEGGATQQLMLPLFFLLFLAWDFRRTIAPAFLSGAALALYYTYIAYLCRTLAHVTLPALAMAVFAFLLMQDAERPRAETVFPGRKPILLVLGILFALTAGRMLLSVGQQEYTQCMDIAAQPELTDGMEEYPEDAVFIFDVTVQPDYHQDQYTFPLNSWMPIPTGLHDNVFTLGGWTGRAPFMLKKLREKYGIANMYDALVERPDVYSCYLESVLDYLSHDRQTDVACSVTWLAGEEELFQYAEYTEAEPVQDGEWETMTLQPASGTEDCPDRMEVSMELPEGTWEHYLLNTTVNGTAYTFRLGEKEGKLWAILCNVPADWEPEGVTTLLGVDEAGNVTALKSLVKE